MAPIKAGINGFGRIGRLVFRAAIARDDIEVVGINDLVPPANIAYLLKYDSTHGPFAGTIEAREDGIVVNGQFIPCMSHRDPAELPWGDLGVEFVIESTGLFTTLDTASKHITAGARHAIISAPTKEKDPDKVPTVVMGVNQQILGVAE